MQCYAMCHKNASPKLLCYYTILLNTGVAPNVKLTTNGLPRTRFFPKIPWQQSNSLTFPGFADKSVTLLHRWNYCRYNYFNFFAIHCSAGWRCSWQLPISNQ